MLLRSLANPPLLLPIVAASASEWPLRAAHRDRVPPPSFDCAMRWAAYAYGKRTIPRKGSFPDLYRALDLDSEDCGAGPGPGHGPGPGPGGDDTPPRATDDGTAPRREARVVPPPPEAGPLRGRVGPLTSDSHPGADADADDAAPPIPPDAVFVDADGDDRLGRAGSASAPFRSIQAAVDYAASRTESKFVVLRGGGEHRIDDTVLLTPAHGGVSIVAYPGEYPVVSGGTELDIPSWEPYELPRDESANIWVADISGQVEEVPGLQIDGVRSTRARYPNIPGGVEVSCGYGCMIPGGSAVWTPPRPDKYGNATYYTDESPSHERPNGGWFERYTVGLNGPCSVYDPPVSYWCSEHPSGGGAFPFRTPSGVTPNETALPHAPYESVEGGLFFVWRPGRWANWMFEIEEYDAASGNFTFGGGGNQGARGNNVGGDYFVENILEELDYPNEFYHDEKSGRLYLYHNGTGPPPRNATFVVPRLRTLVNLTGSRWDPVRDVRISGVTFRASRYTYMDPHGVPSGGDWALERNAAVFLQGTEAIELDGCAFDRLDGNGLMVSGYNRNATVRDSDFSYVGGSAVVAWGYTNETETDPGRPGVVSDGWPAAGVDGTDGEHPRFTRVAGCTAREVGLYEKQSSFFVQAKTSESAIEGNVFFNGPRAGINFNDGFGGGDVISSNLVFSTCRESGDHGPFNSWDRQPFLTAVRDGTPSMRMQWREIHHNFFIDNYSPQEDVDNDDGSAYFKTHDNFLVYGRQGMKNDFGGHDNRHFGNVYAYVGRALGVCAQLDGHEDYFYGNKVVMTGDEVGDFACGGPGRTVLHDNEYFTPTGDVQECGVPLAEWQKRGNDQGSKVGKIPSTDTIIQWARDILHF